MDYPNGIPKRVSSNDFLEAMPAWSPDGKSIVFSTWNAHGGGLYKANLTGKNITIQRLTKDTALFQSAVYNLTGDKIVRSEEHTSELQSRQYLVCRLLLEKKKN